MLDKSIIETLGNYDGKQVAPFRSIADDLGIRPDALEVTITIIESSETNAPVGGTWILKHLLELGLETNEKLGKKILKWLKDFPEKDARLHLLQILNLIDIPKNLQNQFFELARKLTTDKNTFIRAWAYNALGVIAFQNPKYQAETKEYFAQAMKTEPPSVKARIRNTRLYKSKSN